MRNCWVNFLWILLSTGKLVVSNIQLIYFGVKIKFVYKGAPSKKVLEILSLIIIIGSKENSEFKPVKLRLKIDRVSYPARAEGLVNMIIIGSMKTRSVHLARIIIIIWILESFSHRLTLVVFHKSLSDSKSLEVSKTLLSILTDLNIAGI